MQFEKIYNPISKELQLVESELKNIGRNLSTNSLKDILGHFFRIPGKRLRPTLALLSAGVVNNKLSETMNQQLIQLAVGLELMHSASLIHDDIIDGDLFRRGQKTLNKVYGKKIAVLAGDVVYAIAFSTISSSLPKEVEQIIVKLTEYMCAAEVDQAKEGLPDREMYLEIIKGKTALFMSICCKLGATLAGATKEEITSLAEYGLNIGMAYQIIDDCIDRDPNAITNVTRDDAQLFANKAITSIGNFEDSSYKESLINLVNFVLNFSEEKVSNA